MKARKSEAGKESAKVSLDKLALRPSEIDTHTGRIILPKANELSELKGEGEAPARRRQAFRPYRPPEPSTFEEEVTEEEVPPAPMFPSSSPSEPFVSVLPEPDEDAYAQQSYRGGRWLGFMSLLLGFLILGTLAWIGWEVREARLAMMAQIQEAKSAAGKLSQDAREDDAEKSLLEERVGTIEQQFEKLPKILDQLGGTITDLRDEVENLESLEFDVVVPEEDSPDVIVEPEP